MFHKEYYGNNILNLLITYKENKTPFIKCLNVSKMEVRYPFLQMIFDHVIYIERQILYWKDSTIYNKELGVQRSEF